jgi:small subunit ribosomal protein S6
LSDVFVKGGTTVPSYELVYIVNPNISEDTLPEAINKVTEIVKKGGGNVTEVTQWGRKRLAYPIKRFSEGNYILAKVEMETPSVRKIEASLRMNDDVLRHIVIKQDA